MMAVITEASNSGGIKGGKTGSGGEQELEGEKPV
jgi:hypothetical protein